jgi:hypothetical protein
LAVWRDEPAAQRNPKEKAERLGIRAASEKRIAIVYTLFKDVGKSTEAYRRSRELYEAALKIEPINHWGMTQFLSIAATPALAATDAALDAVADGDLTPSEAVDVASLVKGPVPSPFDAVAALKDLREDWLAVTVCTSWPDSVRLTGIDA